MRAEAGDEPLSGVSGGVECVIDALGDWEAFSPLCRGLSSDQLHALDEASYRVGVSASRGSDGQVATRLGQHGPALNRRRHRPTDKTPRANVVSDGPAPVDESGRHWPTSKRAGLRFHRRDAVESDIAIDLILVR